jgi:hypothetical protein
MNNANGDALLARVKVGDRVTLRMPAGHELTGRAFCIEPHWYMRTASGQCQPLRADEIVRVRP